jgi:predicted AAA+ superfamily ATPase
MRKVLLVRGARQIGKTYSIRQLGKQFKHYIEVNFEEHPEIESFFQRSLSPAPISEKLSIYFDTPIIPGETLLFFDEIQANPSAIKSLRFFYEKMPDLHLIAAGSLLEFTLEEIPSFGVGRIQNLFMYPMTFTEYLIARHDKNLADLIHKSSPSNPIDPVIHQKILDLLKIFQLTGGMPEVVDTYIKTFNLNQCQIILDNIITSIIDDFAKYKKRSPVSRLREVFNSIVHQTGKKFKYSNIAEGSSQVYREALDLLIKAGLAYKIHHTSARGLPLAAQINPKKFKVLPFDTGIYQRMLGLNLSDYITSDFKTLINKGNHAELFAGLELIANNSPHTRPELYYWHREAKSSNAEVDYLIAHKGQIIPIEVKSGTRGQMQSIRIFLTERNLPNGIRLSHQTHTTHPPITTLPLYATPTLYT